VHSSRFRESLEPNDPKIVYDRTRDCIKQGSKENTMSTETQEMEMGTKPVREHEWLQQLIGEWRVENEMTMAPDQPKMRSEGRETVTDLGGLWAVAEGEAKMPNGASMSYYAALGYDVSFKKYRGCWFASVSSHLWVQ